MQQPKIIPVEYLATYNAARKAEAELDEESVEQTDEREPETLRSEK